jgi:hypothetical protein
MIGCLMLFPIAGALVALGVYATSIVAFLGTVATAMAIYMGGIFAYFVAFAMFILS